MRHIAMGSGRINCLADLRAPMAMVLDSFTAQLAELQRYRARYGSLEEIEDGSDTEQE